MTAEERDEQLRHLLQLAVDDAGEAILITEAELDEPGPRIVYVNAAFTELTGYPAHEVLGKTPRILQGPRTERAVLDRLRRRLGEGRSFRGETYNYHKDGTEFVLEWVVTPVRSASGHITHWVSVMHDVTERRRIEDDLKRSEARYRSLINDVLDNASIGISILDPDLRVVWLNRAVEQYFSLRRVEVTGRDQRELVQTRMQHLVEDPTRFVTTLLRAYETNTYVSGFECRVVSGEGREARWLEHWSQPIRSGLYAGGRVEYYKDITERKCSEEALRESQRFIRSVADAVPSILYVYDLIDQRNVYVNRKIEDVLGYTPDEIQHMGDNLFEALMHRDDLKRIPGTVGQLDKASEGEVVEFIYRMQHRNGSWRWLQSRDVVLSRTPEGKARRILGTAEDVTERRRAEEALARSEALLSEAERLAHLGSWAYDLQSGKVFWSEEMYRIFDADPSSFSLTREALFERIHPADRARIASLLKTVLREGRSCSAEFQILGRDGEVRVVYGQASVRADDDGHPVQVVGTVHDITERRRLEDKLLRVSEEERRRVGRDLHDGLGQLLTGLGYLSKCLTDALERKGLREATDAREITALLEQAIDHTRSLSRLLLPVELEENGIEAALRRLAARMERIYPVSCTFVSRVSTPVRDQGAALHLYRIAQEALHNAVRHSKARHVWVQLIAGERHLELSVRDDGVGLPRDVLHEPKGMGIRIMQYRAQSIGATLEIKPGDDQGTMVRVTMSENNAGTNMF